MPAITEEEREHAGADNIDKLTNDRLPEWTSWHGVGPEWKKKDQFSALYVLYGDFFNCKYISWFI